VNDLCVFNHITSAFPAMHHTICSKQQFLKETFNPPFVNLDEAYMGFRDMHGNHQLVDPSQELYSARPAGFDPCPAGYHIRLWSDATHTQQTGAAHGDPGQWQAAGIHHEHRVGGAHKLDMPWDDVRVNFYKQMTGIGNGTGFQKYCGSRRWKIHPGAIGRYQMYPNSGYLSRISTTPRQPGGSCAGQ
jgi:hypothetical protein